MGPQQCMVCCEAKSKYKCPVCIIPYCSLGCFKKHKETPCADAKPVLPDKKSKATGVLAVSGEGKPSETEDQGTPVALSVSVDGTQSETEMQGNLVAGPVSAIEKPSIPDALGERPMYVDEPCEILEKAQLESIAAASEIRDALKNEELRKLISNIDSSPDPRAELENVMDMDVFQIFSDKVLSAANL